MGSTNQKEIHVAIGNGKWGSGDNIFEAMRNGKVKKSEVQLYYIFKNNDDWDIFTDGRIEYKEENLIYKQVF